MGTGQRQGLYSLQLIPGPGAYNTVHDNIEGPKYHFAGKPPKEHMSGVPGPGQYSPDYGPRFNRVTFKYSFPGRANSVFGRHAAPGPGAYETAVKTKKRFGIFDRAQRHSLGDDSSKIAPGPGAYQPDIIKVKMKKAPGYSFASKYEDSKYTGTKNMPGPGAYNSKGFIGFEGSKITIIARRPDSAPSYGRNVPGPGSYTPLLKGKLAPSYKYNSKKEKCLESAQK